MKQITILCFNYGKAGKYVNGPGMCLVNFVNILKRTNPDINIEIFTELKNDLKETSSSLNLKERVLASIEKSDVVHHWSGLGKTYTNYLNYAKSLGKRVLIGPNVIDTVSKEAEYQFLERTAFDRILTVNKRLSYRIAKIHNIVHERISVFMVGPDLEEWKPIYSDNGKILWKGNGRQFVKDVNFGLRIQEKLPQYQFEFLGYPNPYDYKKHQRAAKSAHLYICTSLSETMGLALAEQWAAGIPSVTHPNIYLHGENYKTGIITNRDVDSYCKAITEIMEDSILHTQLSNGARNFVEKLFDDEMILANYLDIISNT